MRERPSARRLGRRPRDRLAGAPHEEVAAAWVVVKAAASVLGCGRLTAPAMGWSAGGVLGTDLGLLGPDLARGGRRRLPRRRGGGDSGGEADARWCWSREGSGGASARVHARSGREDGVGQGLAWMLVARMREGTGARRGRSARVREGTRRRPGSCAVVLLVGQRCCSRQPARARADLAGLTWCFA